MQSLIYSLTCIENPEEPPEVKTETLRKLPCIIDNQSNPINHLHEGIQAVRIELCLNNLTGP